MKKCNKCSEIKDLDCFSFRKDTKKYRNSCKECLLFTKKEKYHNNKDLYKSRQKEWREKNKKYNTERHRVWRLENFELNKKIRREYFQKNKEEIYKKRKIKRQNDVFTKLSGNLRNRLNMAIKNKYKLGSSVKDLGCSIKELKVHLESQFQPGMSWDNWSKDGWHIDHIVPLSNFDLSNLDELKKACHYINLQPLWATDNLKKGDRS